MGCSPPISRGPRDPELSSCCRAGRGDAGGGETLPVSLFKPRVSLFSCVNALGACCESFVNFQF